MLWPCSRVGHYISQVWFLPSFFFPCLSAVADWMYTILPHMMRHRDCTKYTLASQSLLWQGDSLDAQWIFISIGFLKKAIPVRIPCELSSSQVLPSFVQTDGLQHIANVNICSSLPITPCNTPSNGCHVCLMENINENKLLISRWNNLHLHWLY